MQQVSRHEMLIMIKFSASKKAWKGSSRVKQYFAEKRYFGKKKKMYKKGYIDTLMHTGDNLHFDEK